MDKKYKGFIWWNTVVNNNLNLIYMHIQSPIKFLKSYLSSSCFKKDAI